jgi:amidase
MHRRAFLSASAAAAACSFTACGPSPTAVREVQLEDAGLAELSEGLSRGRWSTRDLAEYYVNRITTLDRSGPQLNSVIELNPESMKLADALDRDRREQRLRGPLHGIPILLKDNIDTADAMTTTAGSLALEGWRPPQDSAVTAQLRAAGALLLGKTNMSEWANFRSTHSASGWSGRGGQVRNPHALRRSPSGSSSGSGAAVAASLCAAAIGTETDGSIVSPASVNGIVGLKPTLGLIGGAGIVPIAHSQDTAGPMTRSVADAALLLNVLAAQPRADYTKSLDPTALRGARLGIARKFFARNEKFNRFLDAQIDVLKKAGAEVIDEADLPSHGKGGDEEFEVLLYEYKAGLDAYLARQPEGRPVRSIAQLIEFNARYSAREMPWFGQEILQMAQKKGPLTEQKYLDARAACLRYSRAEGIDATLTAHKLDAIVTLTSGPAWLIDHVNGDYDTGGCSSPAAVAGYPHITVPAGLLQGLPVGLSFFSTAWTEPTLFRLAYAFEQATKARVKPRYSEA